MSDYFDDLKKPLMAMLAGAKDDNLTGCVVLGEQANKVGMDSQYFLIDGAEVSKEKFILESGMEHLLEDQTKVKCTKCGRRKSPEFYKKECGSNILNEYCTGVFF
jgi:hypothetical protein